MDRPRRGGVRVLHVTQSDTEGGANRAAYRIHRSLHRLGHASIFHVGRKRGDDPDVVPATWPAMGLFASDVAAYANASMLRAYPLRRKAIFSPARITYGHLSRRLLAEADVVCVHWLSGAFLSFRELLAVRRPIVWRLSDIWPFTGGCHYPSDCTRFEERCGSCPQLGSRSEHDLSRMDFRTRESVYPRLDLTIAAPSRWIAELARRSSLFGERRIEHIPTGIDLTVFAPRPQGAARQRLGLPQDARILAFGALSATDDPRKGFAALRGALERLPLAARNDLRLVIFGGQVNGQQEQLAGLPVHHLGHIGDDEHLAAVYAAADVLAAPFLEDNLPNVVLESLACGTPVAAFAAGGIPDAIDHRRNGYLAPVGDEDELARGITSLLDETAASKDLREAARRTAEDRFDLVTCARRYAALFAELATERGDA
jgi:glycosyltransferase involved in cell wall biosynthesis